MTARADFKAIDQAMARVEAARAAMRDLEKEVNTLVAAALDGTGLGLREAARVMEFSASYVSDVRNGRRAVSAEFILRLKRLSKGR